MQWRNTNTGWGLISRGLHWVSAVGIVAMMVLGIIMVDLEFSPTTARLYVIHKSTGLALLVIVCVRLIWRLRDPPPPFPPTMAEPQRRLARGAHWGFYGLLLALPLSGWVINSAANFPLRWFGLFSVPNIAAPSEDLQALAESVHGALFSLLALLLIGHVAVAIKHHLVDGDDVLRRMWRGD